MFNCNSPLEELVVQSVIAWHMRSCKYVKSHEHLLGAFLTVNGDYPLNE
jgi:hypothetical protein